MRISNGNFLDEDGNEVNLVELLRTGKATPVVNNNDGHHMSAHSGWFTDENGTPVNIVALIDAAIDEDGGDDEPPIGGISINGGNVVTPDANGIINLTISGDGSTVIDSELSASSTNPVQNKVVTGEIEELSEAVDSLNGSLGTLFARKSIDIGASDLTGFIKTDGTWATTHSRSSITKIQMGAKAVEITANSNTDARIAFLQTNKHTNGQPVDFATGTSLIIIPTGTTLKLDIPEDAKYFFVRKTYDESVNTPETAYYLIPDITPVSASLGLHEVPNNESMLNVVKRCRQWTDIKWTPAVDLSRIMRVQPDEFSAPSTLQEENYMAQFKAGVEYKGIPYGRVRNTMTDYGYEYSTVGRYIDFATFISSVSNANSLLCKDDVADISDHRTLRYAGVCSGLASYAYGVPEVVTSAVKTISGMTLIGKINDNGTLLDDTMFKIGDLLDVSGHVAVITDIIRDADGTIKNIEVSEAARIGLADRNYSDGQTGGVARRKGWTREDLFNGRWSGYTVYRYYGNVSYTPSAYVNVGDEFDMYRVTHFPVMPYEGEGFKYKSGYLPEDGIKLIYDLDTYAYVKVFKDGTEISGSPFTLTSGEESINLNVSDTGTYKAFLCNITNGNVITMSYPCHWIIE